MESDEAEEMEVEELTSMWPEDIDEAGKKFNIDKPGPDQDMLEDVTIKEDSTIVDFKRLLELTNYSEKGSLQLANLVRNWEYKQENVVRLLKEELDNLSQHKHEVELKKLEILEEHRFEEERHTGYKRPISILDEDLKYIYKDVPRRKNDFVVKDRKVEIKAEFDSVTYWKQQARNLEHLLEASIQREQILREKLQDSIEHLERQSSPVEELSQVLKRADHFLHFVLQNAPVVIGHQDKDLRYRFIYNHFPSLGEEDIIGKTDVEIFTGAGVKESQDFKREVLERGLPAKREITFDTGLFGLKTFLIYVEPVFSKAGETLGVNYMGMDVTDQVKKREKMGKLREEIAVQKAKESELNKTIHITEETMRAKQMLATMSHEIRSPLSGVVSMTEILSTTILDKEQRQLVKVMMSSGDLVLQLINDILDLSKVESGVMKLEAAKFRPREVIKHVLQTSAASLQKVLTLEGHIENDVPVEVMGDVLRIRQILTNLISNAVKFTHEGKVGVKLYVVREPYSESKQGDDHIISLDQSASSSSISSSILESKGFQGDLSAGSTHLHHTVKDEPSSPMRNRASAGENTENQQETTVWLRCDVYDTGIGIPDNALPTLFKKYMQVSADTARKYGGTGLGLAICKELVELMGGHLTVTSKEHQGSTFTFVLPYKISNECYNSDDSDDLPNMKENEDDDDDATSGFFQFESRILGSGRIQKSLPTSYGFSTSPEDPCSFRSNNFASKEPCSIEDTCSVADAVDTSSEPEISRESHKTYRVGQEKRNQNEIMHDDTRGVSQDISQMQETSSECSSKSCSEDPKPLLKPLILLVDDNRVNVMVAQSMLKQLGHSIEVVNNGAEAVRAVQNKCYDLILMDVCMPVMGGLQATQLIRSFEETGNWDAAENAGINREPSDSSLNCQELRTFAQRRIPIIAMTANSLSESAEECFANGMDSFVSKPVTFQSLRQCLQQYLPS